MRAQTQAIQTASPTSIAAALQERHEAHTSANHRKGLGQYFTPATIARFMASLIGDIPSDLRILDPGAGVGILTAAVVERYARLRAPRHLHVTAFESDPTVLPLLRQTLRTCRDTLEALGHRLTVDIQDTDFVLAHRAMLGAALTVPTDARCYDVVLMNPPYFKINKESERSRATLDVVHEQPNVYSLFMAIGADLLSDGGRFVAITPRSWCSGPYFRRFRRWFLDAMSLQQVHLFESRTGTFKDAGVLQENVITVAIKQPVQSATIRLTRTVGADFDGDMPTLTLPAARVIDDSHGDRIICLPTTEAELLVASAVEEWPKRFQELGLRISTGPVVPFRSREFLTTDPNEAGAVPLLSVHNVFPLRIVWPGSKHGKPSAFRRTPESESLLVASGNYVLLRRFSAKEEKRRLTASALFRSTFRSARVAIENHLNYVYLADRMLTEAEATGIAALMNSRLLDIYFRTISGNTQVNAVDIRNLPFPSLDLLARLGDRISTLEVGDRKRLERTVLDALSINGELRTHLIAEE